jgi:hypothetical protein
MLDRSLMKSPEYAAVHPFGKIPGCKAEDGTGIFGGASGLHARTHTHGCHTQWRSA